MACPRKTNWLITTHTCHPTQVQQRRPTSQVTMWPSASCSILIGTPILDILSCACSIRREGDGDIVSWKKTTIQRPLLQHEAEAIKPEYVNTARTHERFIFAQRAQIQNKIDTEQQQVRLLKSIT